MIPFVARSARKSSFNDYVFTAKRAVTVAAGWTENGNNGRTDSRSEMHQSCVATDKQFRRFTQSNEFLERFILFR